MHMGDDRVLAGLAAMQERSRELLRVQRGTEGSICVVQDMKSHLLRERRAKRERELAFLQARAAPLAERLAELCGDGAAESPANRAASAGTRVLDDGEGLRAVVREALQRGVQAEKEGLAMGSRLCTGANVQRSACGGKMRVVLDASHCGVRLERYAVILQRCNAAVGALGGPVADPAAAGRQQALDGRRQGSGLRADKARRLADRAESPGSSGARGGELPLAADSSSCAVHREPRDGGVESGSGASEESWTVVEHSLPKFIPVQRLAAQLLPGNLRSFVVQVKDYVQALVARREQWKELVRLYAPTLCAAPEGTRGGAMKHGVAVEAARRANRSGVEISSPQVSDAYDSISYILRVAGTAVGAHGPGGGVRGQWMCRVHLQYDDLRRCSPASARVEGVGEEGGDAGMYLELCRGAEAQVQALLLAPGQRLADAVPRIAEALVAHAQGSDDGT